jgi:NAD(P)-dependent dehydrogenase (short-subunit alcohol dehydrogenase family)
MRLKDQVAVVTGGGGGVGASTCHSLAHNGARVMVVDLLAESARRVSDEIKAAGGDADFIALNLMSYAECESMAEQTLKRFGQIDILANVAGGSAGPAIRSTPGPFAESDPARWGEMVQLNLIGTMNPTRAVINHMIERRSGKIVNVSSLAGVLGGTNLADYSAAKGGVILFTRSLAKEVASHGIRVNSIAPGTVGTERVLALPGGTREQYLAGIRMGRFGRPEEMASVILFLASDDASYITGQNITVDGGWGLGPANF